ncbi:MAG: HAMP domain-containing histidine kinase [Gammaproteobacteria bacterium]|nr:HAMP domain-containing histidine kinase [Gammaproteobacteria bacterium]
MPFTSTKSTEKGTGLGLHIVHKIIQATGGNLSYEARSRGGACFKITLPPLRRQTRSK